MESLIFLTEKKDGNIKGRTCANGRARHSYFSKDEARSPAVSTQSVLLIANMDAKIERDVMTL